MTTSLARRSLVVTLVALVVAGLVAYVIWVKIGSAAAREVGVSWTPTCPGTHLSTYDAQPAIDTHNGWRCSIDVTIDNRSGHDVHLTKVDGHDMGHQSGLEVMGFTNDGTRFVSVNQDPGVSGALELDGHWDLDLVVGPGGREHVTLTVGWNAIGCDIGATLGLPQWPRIIFTELGREHYVSAAQTLYLHQSATNDQSTCGD